MPCPGGCAGGGFSQVFQPVVLPRDMKLLMYAGSPYRSRLFHVANGMRSYKFGQNRVDRARLVPDMDADTLIEEHPGTFVELPQSMIKTLPEMGVDLDSFDGAKSLTKKATTTLKENGIDTPAQVLAHPVETLVALDGVTIQRARKIQTEIRVHFGLEESIEESDKQKKEIENAVEHSEPVRSDSRTSEDGVRAER